MDSTPGAEIKRSIRAEAHAAGFDAVGFAAAADDPQDAANLRAYLADGRHAGMAWMAETEDRRAAPRALWPEARSVVVLGMNYGPADDPLAGLGRPERGNISVYARGKDYHDVVKKRLKRVARWMVETLGGAVKVFTDTAPVMEKPLARRAGVGWQGKHTNLVSRAWGSWLFLGEVFTTLDIPPDAPEVDHCGSCDRCLRACPTGALDPARPYRIEPRRCISYLTIEHKEAIDPALAARMGNRIYGCDDCLAVCPWTKFAAPTREPAFAPRLPPPGPPLAELAAMDDAAFREAFAGSPVKRTKRPRMVRNALIAIGNAGDPGLAPVVRPLLDDESDLVRDAAAGALARLEEKG